MDPESGAAHGEPAGSQVAGDEQSMVQSLLKALVRRLQAILGVLSPGRDVGVENRFYYDEVENMWKLQGGETEAERMQSESMRFHTSRGLTDSIAPPTTACDPSRAAESSLASLPPPPTTGGVVHSLHGAYTAQYASMQPHPVYAPQGIGLGQVSPPPDAGGCLAAGPPPQGTRASPFGPPPAARTSPFGAPPASGAAQPAPLTSPFGATQAVLTTPFGAAPPSTGHGAESFSTPLATPFQSAVRGSVGMSTA